jgi:hypothetical protein
MVLVKQPFKYVEYKTLPAESILVTKAASDPRSDFCKALPVVGKLLELVLPVTKALPRASTGMASAASIPEPPKKVE